jgi:N-acetylglucosamine-6-phosphate deacetylase
MTSLLITNARLVTPFAETATGWLHCENGRIRALGFDGAVKPKSDATLDAGDMLLLPGFIDIHVHGGGGHEAMDAGQDTLAALSAFYARHGVTSFLATTWTETRERILAALHAIKGAMAGPPLPGASLLGVHLEGPYLNVGKVGAQNPAYVRPAPRDEALEFLETGVVKLVALAPEIPGNGWLIDECRARGITVSAAHTGATYDDMLAAIARGVTQTTHTFNAMSALHHREPGVVGAALACDELSCELIADNIHVHPGAMKALYNAKGADRIILISDAIRATGMPDGEYPIDNRTLIKRQGSARLADGTLAGSVLTMETAVKNFAAATGADLEDIWQTSSLNAARALRIADRKGSLEPGRDADLVLLDDDFAVQKTIVGGRVVYDAAVSQDA